MNMAGFQAYGGGKTRAVHVRMDDRRVPTVQLEKTLMEVKQEG